MGIAETIERGALALQKVLAEPAAHYIDLETADSQIDNVLVTTQGALVSVIAIEGAKSVATAAWLTQAVDTITGELSTMMATAGHTIQAVFTYDPSLAHAQARSSIEPLRAAAHTIGADMESMLLDWSDSVAAYTAAETVLLAVWTNPEVLPRGESKIAIKDRNKATIATTQGPGAQNITRGINALRDRHVAFCNNLVSTLSSAGLLVSMVTAHHACATIRKELDFDATGDDWRAVLPGDPLPIRLDWADKNGDVLLLYPELKGQLMPRDAYRLDAKTIQIGDRLHRPLLMKLPPQQPRPFQALFARLISLPFPWRVSIRIAGDGLSGTKIKHSLAAVLRHTSKVSKQFYNAIQKLDEAETNGKCVARFQAEFDTWVDAGFDNADRILTERGARLTAAIQSWGGCDVSEVVGDPLLGVSCSVAGVTPRSPAPAAAAPLNDTVFMLPLTRPARVWDSGLPFRSPDGKLLPIAPGSSKQAAWIELMAGYLGSGKSVTANAINLGHFLHPGLDDAPYLTVLDVGPSSRGLYEMIADSLPRRKRYLAAYRKLRNLETDAINPCDTPLGCYRVFPVHLDFLRNFITQLATPLTDQAAPDGVAGLAARCITRAFEDCAPDQIPKTYSKGSDPEVDARIHACGFHPKNQTSWWTIVRVLYDAGDPDMAMQAQRHAVPTVGEIAQYAKAPEIAHIYSDKVVQGEPLTQFFWRSVTEAINFYPVLSGITRLNLGPARVVILDLGEVAKHGYASAERQSAIMYMLGFHIGTAHFFHQPEDLDMVPEAYRSYHRPRFNALRAIPKRMFLDEYHHVSSNEYVNATIGAILQMISRESRKWNIHVSLASQDIYDFNDFFLAIATSIYILGATLSSAEAITKRLKLPAGSEKIISRLRAPNRDGNELFSVIYTRDGEPVVNKLTQTLGREIRIGLESNAWTATVRRYLTDRLGAAHARLLLARHYPDGVAEELERRGVDTSSSEAPERDGSSQMTVLIQELLDAAGAKPHHGSD